MTREQVIKGFEVCSDVDGNCYDCPYMANGGDPEQCDRQAFKDAIALLKAQEPIKPTVAVDTWICSNCGHTLESQTLIDDGENPQVLINEQYDFCPHCGKAVKWE